MKIRIPAVIGMLVFLALACQSVESLGEPEQDQGPREEPQQETEPTSIPEAPPTPASAEVRIQSIPNNAHEAFQVFEKYVNVFGVHIYTDADVSHEKVLHTAGVMAQYLDNNEDGAPDNQKVVNAMTARDAALFMFNSEGTRDENKFIDMAEELHNRGVALQPLYGFECVLNGAARGELDATLERSYTSLRSQAIHSPTPMYVASTRTAT